MTILSENRNGNKCKTAVDNLYCLLNPPLITLKYKLKAGHLTNNKTPQICHIVFNFLHTRLNIKH